MNCPVCPSDQPSPSKPYPKTSKCDNKCSKRTNVHCCEEDNKCKWNSKTHSCSYKLPAWIYQVIMLVIVIGVAILTWFLTKKILLGILVIVIYIVFRVIRKVYGKPTVSIRNVPTKDYMQYIGGVCPDQWVHQKTVNGKDYCHNTYGMTVNDNSICYTDKDNKIKEFSEITGWPPAGDALKARCEWKKQCGPKKNIYASWNNLDCP